MFKEILIPVVYTVIIVDMEMTDAFKLSSKYNIYRLSIQPLRRVMPKIQEGGYEREQ